MPRKPRLSVPGATYREYCRVARGEFAFDDRLEAAEFGEQVQKSEILMVGGFLTGA